MNLLKVYKRNQKTINVYIVLLLIMVTFYVFIVDFTFSKSVIHFLDIIRQSAPLALLALGQTVVLLVGGVDLSVGAVVSITNIMTANIMMGDPARIPLAVAGTLAVCLAIGFINGIVIVKLKVPAFLFTLSMSSMLRGVYMLYTGGMPVGKVSPEFCMIARDWIGKPSGNFLGLFPIAGMIWILAFIVIAFILYKTSFGKKLYATGGNIQASRLCGIPVNRITVTAYMMSAGFACLAGFMVTAFIRAPFLHVGEPYLMNSIAVAAIGGTTFEGGRGGVIGTVAGVLIIQLLSSILTMLGFRESSNYIVLGAILIIILSINYFASTRSRS